MVQINADGAYTRRRANRDELPRRADPILSRFVESRLLVTDRDNENRVTIEVAHEALLRWPRLRSWLDEDRDQLQLYEQIHRAAEEWQAGARKDEFLIHRGARLINTEELLLDSRFQFDLVTRDYLQACIELREAEFKAKRSKANTVTGLIDRLRRFFPRS